MRPHSQAASAIAARASVGEALSTNCCRRGSSLAESTTGGVFVSCLSAMPSMPLSERMASSTMPRFSGGAGLSSNSSVVLPSCACSCAFCASVELGAAPCVCAGFPPGIPDFPLCFRFQSCSVRTDTPVRSATSFTVSPSRSFCNASCFVAGVIFVGMRYFSLFRLALRR